MDIEQGEKETHREREREGGGEYLISVEYDWNAVRLLQIVWSCCSRPFEVHCLGCGRCLQKGFGSFSFLFLFLLSPWPTMWSRERRHRYERPNGDAPTQHWWQIPTRRSLHRPKKQTNKQIEESKRATKSRPPQAEEHPRRHISSTHNHTA